MTPDYTHPLTKRAYSDVKRMLASMGTTVSAKGMDDLVVTRLRQIQPEDAKPFRIQGLLS